MTSAAPPQTAEHVRRAWLRLATAASSYCPGFLIVSSVVTENFLNFP
jgi:hypothetical protein